jgi:hypothetical protein
MGQHDAQQASHGLPQVTAVVECCFRAGQSVPVRVKMEKQPFQPAFVLGDIDDGGIIGKITNKGQLIFFDGNV